MVVFCSTAQEDYSEHTLVCLTNLGDLHLFNVPGLRPQVGPGSGFPVPLGLIQIILALTRRDGCS